ncbi:MAG: hypothetical protein E7582_03890 [Ruminococcaceae bacterium]|nr:hypothetical protein [Oscillospiraceae bacterium]
MKNNVGKIRNAFSSSAFVGVLKKISEFFSKKISSSKSAQLFTSYDTLDEKAQNTLFSKIIKKAKPKTKTLIKLKNKFASKVENSLIYKTGIRIVDLFLGSKARLYGVFLFVFGFFTTSVGFITQYLLKNDGTPLLWQGIGTIILSIPLLSTKEDLCQLLVGGKLVRGILSFIGYKKEDVMRESVEENALLPVASGIILGLLTLVIQPIYIFLTLIAIVLVFVILDKVEFGIVLMVATLPFLPTMFICAEVIFLYFAYIFKMLRGKRSLKFDTLDFFVLVFSVFLLLGGAFSVSPSGSLPPSCVYFVFLSAYFLIVNLIRTTALVKKVLFSSMASLFLCSIYGIFQNFFVAPDTTWTDEDMFSEIETRVVSTFENPNVFGEYLILLIPTALILMLLAKQFSSRSFTFVTLVTAFLSLIYTWSRGAWIGCIASFIILFLIISKNAIGTYVLGLCALPAVIPFLPSSITDRFTSIGNMTDSSTSYRVFIWEASVKMIKDFFFTGIGIGTDAFQIVYTEYALAGIEMAPHSHNLYLQIMLELGIFGFAAFLITLFLLFSKTFSFLRDCEEREIKFLVGALLCGIVAFLVQGLTDYVWYNYRVYAFFWMIVAMLVATIKSGKNETLSPQKNI